MSNWKLGRTHVNILVLAIVTRRFRVPLLWSVLDHPGNGSTQRRIALVQRYLAVFEPGAIDPLLADREFIGADWMRFLIENRIPFAIRERGDSSLTASRDVSDVPLMRTHGRQGRGWRAAIGVAVLYALVLQALLGGVAAARMSAQAPGVICLDHEAAQEGERDGDRHDAGCCQAACRPVQAALPGSGAAPGQPARRALTREQSWRALLVDGPPAPAHASARPRAPPAVA